MAEPTKKKEIIPGLEEALHPEIGNEAGWTSDAHELNLRMADPLKSLDQHLLDENDTSHLVREWGNGGTDRSFEEPVPKKQVPLPVQETKQDEEPTAEPKSKSPYPGPEKTEEGSSKEITEVNVDAPNTGKSTKKEKRKKEKPAYKIGKRIRKVARKLQEEEENKQKGAARKKTEAKSPPAETHLSPFTSWLKGLAGSDYVHPYEEDYAIHQGTGQEGEGISETFADLLAAQGYTDRAIAMYTQLMEKFPEKSRFFAAKIKALQ
jgi:hypothetical protein